MLQLFVQLHNDYANDYSRAAISRSKKEGIKAGTPTGKEANQTREAILNDY
jgi:hypothetical protein